MIFRLPCCALLVGCGTLAAAVLLFVTGCGDASVRAGSENSAAKPEPPIAVAPPAADQKPKLQPGAKTKVLDPAGDRPYDKTFDNLRFDIKPGDPFRREMLPKEIADMAGQRIRIRGYILPTAQNRGIKTFVLVRDNQECCFGPGAALYDCILVEMAPGKTVEYTIRPVAVEGTFDIREVLGPDGKHLAIYYLLGETVR